MNGFTLYRIFPQISRFISAKKRLRWIFRLVTIVLWISLIMIFVFNMYEKAKSIATNVTDPSIILTHPFSSFAHTQVALDLWQKGFRSSARRELRIAQELTKPALLPSSSEQILGSQITPDDILKTWELQEQKMAYDYEFWKNVSIEKPDYRDAYILLVQLSRQLGYTKEATEYLTKAKELDPNSPLVRQIEQ